MNEKPKNPRSKPVLWLFMIIVALTIALGIVATFRSQPSRSAPSAR